MKESVGSGLSVCNVEAPVLRKLCCVTGMLEHLCKDRRDNDQTMVFLFVAVGLWDDMFVR